MYKWWGEIKKGLQLVADKLLVSSSTDELEAFKVGGYYGLQVVFFGLAFWKTHLSSNAVDEISTGGWRSYRRLCNDVQIMLGELVTKLRVNEKGKRREVDAPEGSNQSLTGR